MKFKTLVPIITIIFLVFALNVTGATLWSNINFCWDANATGAPTTITDLKQGNNIALTNTPSYKTDFLLGAVRFNGVNQYGTSSYRVWKNLSAGSPKTTIFVWAKMNATNVDQQLVTTEPSVLYHGWYISDLSVNTPSFRMYGQPNVYADKSTTSTDTSRYTSWVLILNTTNIKAYFAGVSLGTASLASIGHSNSSMVIGRRQDATNYAKAMISQIIIFNTTLTESQLTTLNNSGVGRTCRNIRNLTDTSANKSVSSRPIISSNFPSKPFKMNIYNVSQTNYLGKNMTFNYLWAANSTLENFRLNNGTITTSSAWQSNNCAFAGSKCINLSENKTITTSNHTIPITNRLTACAWVYTKSVGSGASKYILSRITGYPSASREPALALYNNNFGFYLRNSSGASVSAWAAITVSPNTWYYLCATLNATKAQTYINGAINGGAYSTSVGTQVNGGSSTLIGWEGGTGIWNGSLDNIFVWNRSLTESEIATEYTNQATNHNNFPASTTGLVAVYNFEEGAGNKAYDSAFYRNQKIIKAATNGTGSVMACGSYALCQPNTSISVRMRAFNGTRYSNWSQPVNTTIKDRYWLTLTTTENASNPVDGATVQVINTTTKSNYTNTTGNKFYLALQPRHYNLSITAPYRASREHNLSLRPYQNSSQETVTMEGNNGVYIKIKDEQTGAPILTNVSITFTSAGGQSVNYTNTGIFYRDGLNPAIYTLSFSSGNYTARTYPLTITAGSFQRLNAYLLTGGATTTFNIVDKDSAQFIQNATETVQRIINLTWTTIAVMLSDINGRVAFNYDSTPEYKFLVTKTGYNDKSFTLNPVVFSSYSVVMARNASVTNTEGFSGLSFTFSPKVFANDKGYNVTFILSDPLGSLSSYTTNISVPGYNLKSFTGTNAYGQTYVIGFNITGAVDGDKVKINFTYRNPYGSYPFRYNFDIMRLSNTTLLTSNASNPYGLGTMEVLIIITLTVILVGGTAFYYGGTAIGGIVTCVVFGFFVQIGMINQWFVIISLVAGVGLLIYEGSK